MRPLSAWRPARVVLAAAVAFAASSLVDPSAAAQESEWIPPVGGAVVRPFAEPIARYAAGHRGVDFAAAPGTTVHASNDGTVSFAGTVAGSLHVVVAHDGGLRTSYSFLSSLDVRAGQPVAKGQVLGRAGGVGDRHGAGVLHFGVRVGDRYVDPMLLFRPRDLTQIVRLVPPAELAAAERTSPAAERRELVEQLRDSFGCAICGAADWVADRAGEAFDEAKNAVRAAGREAAEWADAAVEGAEEALELALAAPGVVRDALVRTAAGRVALDFLAAGGTLLGWFGRECDEDAPPATGRGGSGNVMYAVAGIDSEKRSPEARSFDLPARLLGYDASERYWYSYREDSEVYTKEDTYQDLRKSARLLAEQLKAAAEAEPGRAFDLVGHSQGGVVIALFLVELYEGHESEYPPIDHVVTFASPLDGAPLSTSGERIRRSPTGRALTEALGITDDELDLPIPDPNARSARQLAETSEVIQKIQDAGVPEGIDFTSISGVSDWQVPSIKTRVRGARSHDIDVGDPLSSHKRITSHPRALMAARAALEDRALPCTSFEEALQASAGSFLLSSLERAPTLPPGP